VDHYLRTMAQEADHLAGEYERLYESDIEAMAKAHATGKSYWGDIAARHKQTANYLREVRGFLIHGVAHRINKENE